MTGKTNLPAATSPVGPSAASAWLAEKLAKARTAPRFKLKSTAGKVASIEMDTTDQHEGHAELCRALGSASSGFCHSLVGQLAAAPSEKPDDAVGALNDALSFIASHGPESELECMLVAQAWLTHAAVLEQHQRLAKSVLLQQQDAHGILAVKLAKLFVQQTDAIAKLRNAGKQKIEVIHTHVHVHKGANAVVGTVNTGGGLENASRPHDPAEILGLAYEPGTPVWSENPIGEPVPIARGEGSSAMPVARMREGSGRPDGLIERPLPDGAAHDRDDRGSTHGAEADRRDDGPAEGRLSERPGR